MKLNRFFLSLGLVAAVAAGGPKDNPVNPSGGDDTPAVNPSAPTGLKVHKAEETALQFQWDDMKGATSYDYTLSLDGTLLQEGNVKTRNVTVSGLTKATTYTFTVFSLAKDFKSSGSSVSAKTAGTEDPIVDPVSIGYEDFMIPAVEEDGVARAFPGAEGGGMYVTGGRGGKVYHVTKLTDDGSEGTLRWAVKQSGPRIIVFDVAGIIELSSDLKIEKGDVTIAGQTAPGDGICLKNYTTYIGADNVIIRFLRFRLGDEAPWADADIKAGKADGEDAVWGRYQHNIILDHCSMSWSIDETASFYANENFTMQWCIVSESMKSCRLHSKGDHGYGGIWGGKNASFHHNLLAHHQNRTPRFDHQYLYDGNNKSTDEFRGNVDYRNCVNYNWGSSNGCYGGEGGHFNLVNNYYKKGPNSNDKKYFIEADGGYTTGGKQYPYDWAYLYLSGNYNNEYPSGDSSYPDGVYWKKAYSDYNLPYDAHVVSAPFVISGKDGKDAFTTTHSAQEAMERVCAYAGASLSRDAVDSRICQDVKEGKGKLISSIEDVRTSYGSAWPSYNGTKVTDTDGDGIPDSVEDEWGLNKNIAADGEAVTLDKNGRYTNLEMYLHFLVKDVVSGGNAGGDYTKL